MEAAVGGILIGYAPLTDEDSGYADLLESCGHFLESRGEIGSGVFGGVVFCSFDVAVIDL